MDATIIARTPTSFTLQVEVPYNDSMLGFEEALQQRLNDAGILATAEGLKRFDTDGAPSTVGAVKLTTKGPVEKDYQTPYYYFVTNLGSSGSLYSLRPMSVLQSPSSFRIAYSDNRRRRSHSERPMDVSLSCNRACDN